MQRHLVRYKLTDLQEEHVESTIGVAENSYKHEASSSVLRLLVTANVFPSSSILFTLMMEVFGFSEPHVVTSQ
jgi:hypothetical protein